MGCKNKVLFHHFWNGLLTLNTPQMLAMLVNIWTSAVFALWANMERVEYLLQMVSGSGFGQIFITDSNKVRMDSLVEKVGGKCRNFEVKSGTIVAAE